MSFITAPVGDVTTPIVFGYFGGALLRSGSNIPSFRSLAVSSSNFFCDSPFPYGVNDSMLNPNEPPLA